MGGVLITGGTGLIGMHLTEALLSGGYTVHHLSRRPGADARVKTFVWDVNKGVIDENCIDGITAIIHLAGAGIADEKWSDKRKRVIIESRTKSIRLIYDLLKRKAHTIKTVISASGISYYGHRGNDRIYESDEPVKNFLGICCIEWEHAVDEMINSGIRTVKFRTGLVLDKRKGALPKMALPVKWGMGVVLGSGKQWVSWIHIQDAVNMYIFALENEIHGAYNMVAPNPVTYHQLTKAISKVMKRPLWLPNVPAIILKKILGDVSMLVLDSISASAQKIQAAGYQFRHTTINSALKDIYNR